MVFLVIFPILDFSCLQELELEVSAEPFDFCDFVGLDDTILSDSFVLQRRVVFGMCQGVC